MANDSSTGGYLAPSSINGDLNDDALIDALQAAVVGITGLPGPMVRPRWQPEAPDPPDLGTNWAAIGPSSFERDFNSYRRKPDGETTIVIRNRVIEILCSFYGPNGQADAELLAMGLEVPQNRVALQQAGYGLMSVSAQVIAPALIKGKWYPKYDITLRVRQQQTYTYSVLDVVKAQATLCVQPPGQPVITETVDESAPAQQ